MEGPLTMITISTSTPQTTAPIADIKPASAGSISPETAAAVVQLYGVKAEEREVAQQLSGVEQEIEKLKGFQVTSVSVPVKREDAAVLAVQVPEIATSVTSPTSGSNRSLGRTTKEFIENLSTRFAPPADASDLIAKGGSQVSDAIQTLAGLEAFWKTIPLDVPIEDYLGVMEQADKALSWVIWARQR